MHKKQRYKEYSLCKIILNRKREELIELFLPVKLVNVSFYAFLLRIFDKKMKNIL